MDDNEEEDDEQFDAGLKIFALPFIVDLKLLFTSQLRDKYFDSLTFVDTLELCCSKAMAVLRALFSTFLVVVTRLKL